MDTELETVLDEGFLDGHERLDADRLRDLRARCSGLERAVSYLRRLAQARIDIVTAELDRRAEGGDPARVADLVSRLPAVLADGPTSGPSGPLATSVEPEVVEGALADELATMELAAHLDSLGEVPTDELRTIRGRLVDYERRVSGIRRVLFERIDVLGVELGRRYRTGEADIARTITGS